MARRPNPENIFLARRAAIGSRLGQTAVLSAEDIERWLAAWEAEGVRQGLDRHNRDFWMLGDEWIEGQLRRRSA